VSQKRRKDILPFTQRGIPQHRTPHYELHGDLKSRKLSPAVTVLTILAFSGEVQAPNLNRHVVYFNPAVHCFYLRPLGQIS
jgi:hypothetical protein